jgi:hypothetical protein
MGRLRRSRRSPRLRRRTASRRSPPMRTRFTGMCEGPGAHAREGTSSMCINIVHTGQC